MTTANNPVVTAELLRETLGRVIDVLDDAGGFSDVPAVREAKRVYIMSRAALQSIGPMRGWEAAVESLDRLAMLAGDVNMNDPLSKWFTVANFYDAKDALKSIGIEGQG